MIVRHPPTVAAIRDNAIMLSESPRDYDPLLHLAKDRSFVLLGEATHGTHEFYAMRAAITRRLIQELGFDAVAVEGDWPDVYRLNRYVHGTGPATLDDAFDDFQRFPAWIWRNHDVQAFIQWLHAYNAIAPEVTQVGIYGLDLYSLYRSAEAVIDYLERMDPEQASVARKLYAGLDEVQDPQEYNVDVEVVSDRGTVFQLIPHKRYRIGSTYVFKQYLEAKKDENYNILIRNHLSERIGVVIAVDGRNSSPEKNHFWRATR